MLFRWRISWLLFIKNFPMKMNNIRHPRMFFFFSSFIFLIIHKMKHELRRKYSVIHSLTFVYRFWRLKCVNSNNARIYSIRFVAHKLKFQFRQNFSLFRSSLSIFLLFFGFSFFFTCAFASFAYNAHKNFFIRLLNFFSDEQNNRKYFQFFSFLFQRFCRSINLLRRNVCIYIHTSQYVVRTQNVNDLTKTCQQNNEKKRNDE